MQFATFAENAELSAPVKKCKIKSVVSSLEAGARSEFVVRLGPFNGCAVDRPAIWRTAQVRQTLSVRSGKLRARRNRRPRALRSMDAAGARRGMDRAKRAAGLASDACVSLAWQRAWMRDGTPVRRCMSLAEQRRTRQHRTHDTRRFQGDDASMCEYITLPSVGTSAT